MTRLCSSHVWITHSIITSQRTYKFDASYGSKNFVQESIEHVDVELNKHKGTRTKL